MKLYIAYGSNMHTGQMAQRCYSAKVLGKGILRGYRMMFRGALSSGVATIERSDGDSLPVLLWEITEDDEKALDRYEGYPHLYRKEMIPVFFDGRKLRAMAYVMNERYPYTVPSRGYESIIASDTRCEGYREDKYVRCDKRHENSKGTRQREPCEISQEPLKRT